MTSTEEYLQVSDATFSNFGREGGGTWMFGSAASMSMYTSLPYSDRILSGFMILYRLPTSKISCKQGGGEGVVDELPQKEETIVRGAE